MTLACAASACAALWANAAGANPPLEAYGDLPAMRAAALSPSAEKYAFFSMKRNEGELVNIFDMKTRGLTQMRVDKIKARTIRFVDENNVVVIASKTMRYGVSEKYEYSGAGAINLQNKKVTHLLKGTKDLYPLQSGLGWIAAVHKDKNAVFMPAYMGPAYANAPPLHLLSVSLKTGRGRVHARGGSNTRDWIISPGGAVLAREDWNDKSNEFRIVSKRTGSWETVYETISPLYPFHLFGVLPDESALVVLDGDGADNSTVRVLSFDGKLSSPLFTRTDRDIAHVFLDINRRMTGVKYSGPTPTYEFFDDTLNADVDLLLQQMQGLSVSIEDLSADTNTLLVHISGSGSSPAYFLYNRKDKTLLKLGDAYPGVADEDVGAIFEIKYKARDGYAVPAILTTPPGVAPGEKKLPLIVMPHGGPQSYDDAGFDWMAQYFANRGYMVLQPNFRGSSGFGKAHLTAGYGEWGGLMQDDVTDGVKQLINNEWADASRVCIIGASYGGYAALAGGAFTPDLYQCVAAIAPVADLHQMFAYVGDRNAEGDDSYAYKYWTRFIGDRRRNKQKLKAISPINSAENFKAPVLLIHGVDDTVVRFNQSARMARALKKAGKPVKLVRLKGEDHWLSTGETRLQTLRELATFVDETIGRN